MKIKDYLALLSLKNHPISFKDFEVVEEKKLENPEHLSSLLSSLETRRKLSRKRFWWKEIENLFQEVKRKNYQLLYPGLPFYPKSFEHLFLLPPIFTYLGNLPKPGFYLSLVGSRFPDERSVKWLERHLYPILLQKKDLSLLSGGAVGIDQKAHSLCFLAKRQTLCFLPSGLDTFYPKSLNHIKSRVLDAGGGFISPFHPSQDVRRYHFAIRNQYIAAFSDLVFMLQGKMRSGSMITARKAIEFSIPLCTLPGLVMDENWEGNLGLLYDGASMIRDYKDLSLLIESLMTTKAIRAFQAQKNKHLEE